MIGATRPFSVCPDCFRNKRGFEHRHGPEKFLDNFALLEEMRKLSAFARDDSRENNRNRELVPSSSSIHQTNFNFICSPSSGRDETDAAAASLLALVPTNIREHWTTAYRVYEAAVYFKSLVSACTIV